MEVKVFEGKNPNVKKYVFLKEDSVYEAVVYNKSSGNGELVQLTLRDVMNKCAGTNFEEPIKRAIMKCVYTDAKLDNEIRKVMDEYFQG